MNSAFPMAKLAINVVASIGVSKVVNDIVRNNVNIVTTADAVKVWTGTIVIGSIVADHASKHLNERVDQIVEWNKNRKESKDDSGANEPVWKPAE